MGFALPSARRLGVGSGRPGEPSEGLAVSHLSPLDRRLALPPHHPQRTLDGVAFPYPLWSGGLPDAGSGRPPDTVHLRGGGLGVAVNLRHGGVISAMSRDGKDWKGSTRAVAGFDDVRGVGLRGGIELNCSSLVRSPFSLDAVFAAVGLPSRFGGDRLRWWQLERASNHLVQVDLHVMSDAALLLIVVRQTALGPAGRSPQPRLVMDDAQVARVCEPSVTLLLDQVAVWAHGTVVAESEPSRVEITGHSLGGTTSWFALSLDDEPQTPTAAELDLAVRSLDDPVLKSCGHMISYGAGWAALELERLRVEGAAAMVDLMATPVPGLEHEEISTRRRSSAEAQWLHLMRDEGLGTIDRVHPKDVGQPAGTAWTGWLQRAHRREALGDWRVHLREGEIAALHGDLAEAEARWSWSYALRPTAWSDRNLALVRLAQGRPQDAAVTYLRAQRTQPDEIELGVEAIGVLIASGRASDGRQVLDRMLLAGHGTSVRTWLLEAEVALATGHRVFAAEALSQAVRCDDATVHQDWADALFSQLNH
ncbi:hypothetical protein GCM10023339_76790 [Alloalcanivorax gelatiniphagus]